MKRVLPVSEIGRFKVFMVLLAATSGLCSCAGENIASPESSANFDKQLSSDIRVMSWNVKLASVMPPDGVRKDGFARIVRSIDPDIIALQEIAAATALVQLMNAYIPLENNRSWEAHTVSDNVIVSRFPMRWRGGELTVPYPYPQLGLPNFHYGFAASLVELSGGAELLVVAMHNKSGGRESDVQLRQDHADAIVRWIRDSRGSGQEKSIPDNTPVVILGDMNVVSDASMAPYETLITGDISDEETSGSDIKIDWDETDLTDAKPSHNGLEREYYTWRNDDLPFAPSALDRILYTDSVMSVRHRFVLNTMTLAPEDLSTLGLQKSDTLFNGNPRYYDHLPLVVDFAIGAASLE